LALPPALKSSQRARTWLAVLVPAAVAIGLSAYDVTARSLWIDESATVSIASQHGAALWAGMRHDGGNMLAYYALMHVLFSLFGDSTLVLRLPSVIASGVAAAAVAAIGVRLFRPAVGLAAGLLTAISVGYVYWEQNGRAYALMFAFGALSYLGFIHLVDGESRSHPGRPSWWAPFLYAGALVLAVYMSTVALLVVPAQLLSLCWYRRRLRMVAICLAVVAVASLPVLLLAQARGSSQLFWVPRPEMQSTTEVVQAVSGSGLAPVFARTASSLPLLGITVALVLAAAAVGIVRARSHPLVDGVSRQRWAGALVASWLVIPVLIDFVESFVGTSIFQSRYLLVSAPAVALLVAWVLLCTRLPQAAGWAGVAALAILRLAQITPSYGVSPESWRAATHYVLVREEPGDCVLFYPSDVRQAFDYYVLSSGEPASRWPRPVLPTAPFREIRPFVEDYATLPPASLARVAAGCRRMWFVSSHAGVASASAVSRAHYFRYVALVHGLGRDYPYRRLVRISYASQIDVWLFARQPLLNH
jgi:mannosyltransferase